ncbi:hypothetical protein GCM10010274_44210 [Streptomyces lavendofoliae]|uniref:ATP-dependent DNA ligase n=1 Tax=Streptomyces lavendofoliae TaxID=67314 RepID=A0A918I0J5_9ACTN|nr:hypothetical protein GCM10010274_44210 [Streptomyces lavendofoliae]
MLGGDAEAALFARSGGRDVADGGEGTYHLPLRCLLRLVGRSTLLRPDAARDLAERLTPAGPRHPWEGVRFTTSWGSRTPLDVVLVEPEMVAEITVDTVQERGSWRHPVRFARLRLDVAGPLGDQRWATTCRPYSPI